jgi:hypothetical protein
LASQSNPEGMTAVAFIDETTMQIVIAYRGSATTFDWLSTDTTLASGTRPPEFSAAEAFATSLEQQYTGYTFYVTDHSLGGAEAEDVAAALDVGGVTFGAPGVTNLLQVSVPANLSQPGPTLLTDYVNAYDPLANYVGLDPDDDPGLHVGQVATLSAPIYYSLIYRDGVGLGFAMKEFHPLYAYGQALVAANLITSNPIGTSVFQPVPITELYNNVQNVVTGTDSAGNAFESGTITQSTGNGTAVGQVKETYTTSGDTILSDTETIGPHTATELTTIDGSGTIISDQVTLDGATILSPPGAPASITFGSNGSLIVGLPSSQPGQEVTIVGSPDGSIAVMQGDDQSGPGQQIVVYASGTLSGDTLSIPELGAGDTSLNTQIQNGNTVEVVSDSRAPSLYQYFSFLGSSGTLKLDSPVSFAGTILGFVPGTTIDLAAPSIGLPTGATLAANNVLTVQTQFSSGLFALQLDPTQDFTADSFMLGSDGSGGTNIGVTSDSQNVTLPGPNTLFLVPTPASFTGTISGFLPGATIDLAGIRTATSATLGTGNVLSVQGGASNVTLNLDPSQDYRAYTFGVASDGNGGTDITVGLKPGYYIVRATDLANGTSTDAIANSIGQQLSPTLDGPTVERINAVFSDSSFTVGGLVHVPAVPVASVSSGVAPPVALPPQGETDVFDPTNDTTYKVGASLDGHDSRALIIDTPVFGGFATFGPGTYSGYDFAYLQANGDVTVTLTSSSGETSGTLDPFGTPGALTTLAFNPSTDAGVLTLSDGLQIPVPGGFAIHLTDPVETPEQVLLSYLSQLGAPETAAQLDQSNFNYLNPVGTAHTVTGSVAKVDDTHANVYYYASTAGAIVAGQPSATITDYYTAYDSNGNPYQVPYDVQAAATNYLEASGDISQDTITGIQVLVVQGVITLTQAQFGSFGTITGVGTIAAATSGTFDLNSANIDPNSSFNLTATDWLGTTLIGNGQNNQTLQASLIGNDALIAGSGSNDVLIAGSGVDTLIGGGGNDTFAANNGLAAGSVIQGGGGSNTLQAFGDISGASVSGVQTLLTDDVTLNATELSGFSSIEPFFVPGFAGVISIVAATSGTYSLAGKTTGQIEMIAGTSDGTTLIGNDAAQEELVASTDGNDVLTAGNGNQDILDASGSFGNDQLTAGNGNSDYLNVSDSTGNNTLTAGGGNTDTLDVSGSFGNDVLIGGNGVDTLIAGNGADTLQGGTGNDVFVFAGTLAPGTVIDGGGGNDVLQVQGNPGVIPDISAATISNVQTLEAGAVTLTAAELNGFGTIQAYDGQPVVINAKTAGTYSLVGKNIIAPLYIDLSAEASGGTTLIGNDEDNEYLQASESGNDTLIAGNGNNDILSAGLYTGGSNTGNDTLTAGDGNNDSLVYLGPGNSVLTAGNGSSDSLFAGGGGQGTLTGGSGGDVFSVGNGNYNVYGGTGNDSFTFGAGDAYLQGNGGNDIYYFDNCANSPGTQNVINNFHTDDGQSVLQLENVAATDVIATVSNGDLVLTMIDTGDTIVVQSYFTGADYQLSSIEFSDGTAWNYQDALAATAPPTVTVTIDNTDVNVANNTGTVTFAFSKLPIDFSLTGVAVVGA